MPYTPLPPWSPWLPAQDHSWRPSASWSACTTPSWANSAMLPAVTGDDSVWGLLPKVGRGTCQRTWPLTLTSVAHACRGGTGPPHPGSSRLCDGRGELRGVVAAWVAPGWVVPQAARLTEQTATIGTTPSRLIRIPL